MRQSDRSVRPIKVTIKTSDGSVFRGSVNVGPRERVSDLFTRDDPDGIIASFVILFDVSESSDKEFIAGKRVYFINRHHIVWVRPDDEQRVTKGEKWRVFGIMECSHASAMLGLTTTDQWGFDIWPL